MKTKPLIAMSAPVTITAGTLEGENKSPPKFEATFYTGGALDINGWELPVVVDLAGLKRGNVLVANLDHKSNQRVGNFDVANDGKSLVAHGTATARTPARDEVVGSAADGYQWQASLEVNPSKIETVKEGKTVTVNGQEFTGPLYVTRAGTLKGFAFVSHGADDATTVSIAAIAANKERQMDAALKSWIEGMGFNVDELSDEQIKGMTANFAGQPTPPKKKAKFDDAMTAKEAEIERQDRITEIALAACDKRPYDIKSIKELAASAIEEKWTVEKFHLELLQAAVPLAGTVLSSRRHNQITNEVVEAAICQAGRLPETGFSDQALQVAHDKFKGRLGLKQLFLLCAEANGYRESTMDVTLDVQRAAFRMGGPMQIHASGFSTLDISTILSNTANKSLMTGWNSVDQTCLRISKIQAVRDFKQITVVSLTDSVRYEQIAGDGQIKHGTLGELTYTNQAATYAKMLAITRTDIINDDTSALTEVPAKLGRGAIKILNHIFWTEFLALVGANFFASGNSNINTGVADMTLGGLDATETIFMNQTNPDGTPLGLEPKIILVPTALKNKAITLMTSEKAAYGTSYATAPGDGNPFQSRFRVESSPYISSSTYTGNTSTAWWMLADPMELPVIAIAALNGRVEPTVESADADFNTLGVQMRGYCDVGVKRQEYRGGVHADGGSS